MSYDNEEDMLALSIYNESIAIAIRRGAPLASYSIDRKCLNEYMKHLIRADTAALICFSCARKYPCLFGSKQDPIRRYRVQTDRTKGSLTSSSRFFGMSTESATDIFGLARYCARYGAVSHNVTLSEDDAEFEDWHVLITFDNEYLKLLRCPEDLLCEHILKGVH